MPVGRLCVRPTVRVVGISALANCRKMSVGLKIVVGWLALHEEEAYAAWNQAVQGEHFEKIKAM